MRREDIFQPGTYIALPKTLAADTTLTASAKLVWAVLADRLGENDKVWPGESTIARDAGVSPSSASRAIDQLKTRGWLTLDARLGKTSLFYLNRNPIQNDLGQNERGSTDPIQNDLGTPFNLTYPLIQNDLPTSFNLADELPNTTNPKEPPQSTTPTLAGADAPAGIIASATASAQSQAPGLTPASSAKPQGEKRAKGEKREKSPGLTPAEVQALSAFPAMERYLLFGRAGIFQEDTSGLTPTSMNWRAVTDCTATDSDAKYAAWTASHFAAFFWFNVSKHRRDHGQPCALPEGGWGRICAATQAMLKTMTRKQIFDRIYKLYLYMPLFKDECAWMTTPPTLNEGTLQDAPIRKMIQDVERSTDEQLTARWAKQNYTIIVSDGLPRAQGSAPVAAPAPAPVEMRPPAPLAFNPYHLFPKETPTIQPQFN